MRERTLEDEFEFYKLRHKTTILQAKLTLYYKTIQESGIKNPFFMLESPEKKAEKEVQKLLGKNRLAFEMSYDKAWTEYAECLP